MMRGIDVLGLPSRRAPPVKSAPPPKAPPKSTAPPPAKPPAAPAKPSPRAVASAQKAQAAANRAIAAGQKLSRHHKNAGQKLIATGNAHNTRAQALLKVTTAHQRGIMGDYIGQAGPDPGVVDPQSDAVNAIAQLGELANQMLDWVTTLQTSGPQAARQQVVAAQRGM